MTDEEREARLVEKRKDAARRRALGHVVAGIDLDQALAAYRKFPPFVGNLGRIKLEVAHRESRGSRGTAWTRQRRLRIAAGPDITPERALSILVHEMVHLAVPDDVHHGERFRLTLRRAFIELWGIFVPINTPPVQGCIAYGMDTLVQAQLRLKIQHGTIPLFPPTPKEPTAKPTRAELGAKVVEKRAAHAVKMMNRAKRLTENAQRLLTKWRKKVRYYERQAAKKASR